MESKKSLNLSSKQLLLNKAVILVHIGKYNEANKILKQNLKGELELRHLPL